LILNDKSESVYVTPGCKLTLYKDGPLGTGTSHVFTHNYGIDDAPENDNFGLINFSNHASTWRCSCNPRLEILATCPSESEKQKQDGEFVAFGSFMGRTIYQKPIPDSSGNWWFLRFDIATDRWGMGYWNAHLTEGATFLKDLTIEPFDLNVEGLLTDRLESELSKVLGKIRFFDLIRWN